jgi:hypothetical protein
MAKALRWYSGMCTMLCIIERVGAVETEESVWVFRATGRKDAIKKFLELARTQDHEFRNADGERVRWTVSKLANIDELEEGELKDREVYSRISPIEPPDASISIDQQFTPEHPEPGPSGV